jgi:hypothetical protein
MSESWSVRAERVLPSYQSSFAEYYLLGTAGYRVPLERSRFIEHAAWEFQGHGWPPATGDELTAALDRLVSADLMTVLTEDSLRAEADRRAASALPEVEDAASYRPGHIDFTERGYGLYRTLVREICGDEHKTDHSGFNLEADAGRFDIYAVSAAGCATMMDTIQQDGDAYTGVEHTKFISREEPVHIGAWRPNRFSCQPSGYDGILRYIGGAAQPAVAADGASPRR